MHSIRFAEYSLRPLGDNSIILIIRLRTIQEVLQWVPSSTACECLTLDPHLSSKRHSAGPKRAIERTPGNSEGRGKGIELATKGISVCRGVVLWRTAADLEGSGPADYFAKNALIACFKQILRNILRGTSEKQ